MKYLVLRREVWIQPLEIEAANEKEAVELVADGDGEVIEAGFEYSHTLDPEVWSVEEGE
jgi:hypothetical protein